MKIEIEGEAYYAVAPKREGKIKEAIKGYMVQREGQPIIPFFYQRKVEGEKEEEVFMLGEMNAPLILATGERARRLRDAVVSKGKEVPMFHAAVLKMEERGSRTYAYFFVYDPLAATAQGPSVPVVYVLSYEREFVEKHYGKLKEGMVFPLARVPISEGARGPYGPVLPQRGTQRLKPSL